MFGCTCARVRVQSASHQEEKIRKGRFLRQRAWTSISSCVQYKLYSFLYIVMSGPGHLDSESARIEHPNTRARDCRGSRVIE